MILHVSPSAPVLVRDAANLILALHIGGGTVALTSGAAAMALRKGSPGHRLAGNIFFASMLLMAAIGATVALALPQRTSVISGVFTLYLVATGWMTARRPAKAVSDFELAAAFVAITVALAEALFGFQSLQPRHRQIDGIAAPADFAFATVAALAAISDFGMILDGGIAGSKRLVRHLWRMSLALFIAATSLFLGQSQVFPAPLRESPLLVLPPLAVLAMMAGWLVALGPGTRLRGHGKAARGWRWRGENSRGSAATHPDRCDFPPTAGCNPVGTPH